jgi:hypothetical protein
MVKVITESPDSVPAGQDRLRQEQDLEHQMIAFVSPPVHVRLPYENETRKQDCFKSQNRLQRYWYAATERMIMLPGASFRSRVDLPPDAIALCNSRDARTQESQRDTRPCGVCRY